MIDDINNKDDISDIKINIDDSYYTKIAKIQIMILLKKSQIFLGNEIIKLKLDIKEVEKFRGISSDLIFALHLYTYISTPNFGEKKLESARILLSNRYTSYYKLDAIKNISIDKFYTDIENHLLKNLLNENLESHIRNICFEILDKYCKSGVRLVANSFFKKKEEKKGENYEYLRKLTDFYEPSDKLLDQFKELTFNDKLYQGLDVRTMFLKLSNFIKIYNINITEVFQDINFIINTIKPQIDKEIRIEKIVQNLTDSLIFVDDISLLEIGFGEFIEKYCYEDSNKEEFSLAVNIFKEKILPVYIFREKSKYDYNNFIIV